VGAVDLAENYPTADETLAPGEIVASDPTNPLDVVRYDAAAATSTPPLGIVSTQPGFLLGVGQKNGPLVVPIALAGRVPLKISLENGPLNPGDYIMPSPNMPGYGVKAITSGMMIGIALESTDASASSTDTAVITAFVRPQFAFVAGASALTLSLGAVVPSPLDTNATSIDSYFNDLVAATTSSAILTADNKSLDLFKLATFALQSSQVLANKISAHDVRLTALEKRVTALESGAVSSAGSSPIVLGTSTLASALEGFGVLIDKGIAQFNTLVFRQLVASKDADGTSSAGTGTILTGNTVEQVINTFVATSTKVFVTFNASVTGSWWVADKTAGSFRVILSAPQAGDVSFDYFLVQTEGQMATSSPVISSPPPAVDTVAPVVTLVGGNPVHLAIGDTFTDPGVTVVDAVDGTDPVVTYINGTKQEVSSTTIDTSKQASYIVTYTATDKAGNTSEPITRSVIVDGAVSGDTTPPVVTLIGAAALDIVQNSPFTDPGATALDAVDGDLTSKIVETGSVATTTPGIYTLTYTATDAAHNIGSVSRVVTVTAAP